LLAALPIFARTKSAIKHFLPYGAQKVQKALSLQHFAIQTALFVLFGQRSPCGGQF